MGRPAGDHFQLRGIGTRGNRQITKEVRHVQVVFVHAADRAQDRLECLLALAKGHHVERHVPEAHLAGGCGEGNRDVASIIGARREERKDEAVGRALHGEPLIFAVERLTHRPVALQQVGTQPEELHFLRVGVGRQYVSR